jgi:tRNA (uracil-5-)-methyltransferase TRM9
MGSCAMTPETEKRLLELNQDFYSAFARSFAETRIAPQPGFQQLLDYIPVPCCTVVDVGCGNGRFGLFLRDSGLDFAYTGVDFTDDFLQLAGAAIDGVFLSRDISRPGYLEGQGRFDLGVCLATLQHIPGQSNRAAVLREMAHHLAENGRIFLSNWQFAHSARQMRKIVSWEEAGLHSDDVQQGDYLMTWQRDGRGLRYVHLIDREETAWLAKEASLRVVDEYRSDGREGDLNLYSILTRNV